MRQLRPILVLAVVLLSAAAASAQPAFVNGLVIPGNTIDATRVPGANAGRFGLFSDLYYDPVRDEWWALSDRGPGGGLIDYSVRAAANRPAGAPHHRTDLELPRQGDRDADRQVRVARAARRRGRRAGGAEWAEPGPPQRQRRAARPQLRSRGSGRRSPHRPLPHRRRIRADRVYEFIAQWPADRGVRDARRTSCRDRSARSTTWLRRDGGTSGSGRQDNRGYEGLAISPDGTTPVRRAAGSTARRGPDTGDRQRRPRRPQRPHRRVRQRVVEPDVSPEHRAVRLPARAAGGDPRPHHRGGRHGERHAIRARAATSGSRRSSRSTTHEFLVLERDNRGIGVDNPNGRVRSGRSALGVVGTKRVYKIDITGATDVSSAVAARMTATLPRSASCR